MKNKKCKLITSIVLLAVAIVFTVLVKIVDVQAVGPEGTNVGFATLNMSVFTSIGTNMLWYDITDILGKISLGAVAIYAIIGFIQLIKRKNILKVDKEIMALGGFYVVVAMIYVLFEKVIINFRPILMEEGILEASYPSSHTLMTICILGSATLVNKKLYNNKITKVLNIIAFLIIVTTVIGRLISGVHWFTDILGGLIISFALLMCLSTVLDCIKKNK